MSTGRSLQEFAWSQHVLRVRAVPHLIPKAREEGADRPRTVYCAHCGTEPWDASQPLTQLPLPSRILFDFAA